MPDYFKFSKFVRSKIFKFFKFLNNYFILFI